MPTPRITVGLGTPSQPPLVEYIGDGQWRVWLSYSRDTPRGKSGAGTYLLLYTNGRVDRMTEDEEGISFSHIVKPPG